MSAHRDRLQPTTKKACQGIAKRPVFPPAIAISYHARVI